MPLKLYREEQQDFFTITIHHIQVLVMIANLGLTVYLIDENELSYFR